MVAIPQECISIKMNPGEGVVVNVVWEAVNFLTLGAGCIPIIDDFIGAGVGATGGATVGAAGLAAGGVGVVATEPLGIAGGAVSGTLTSVVADDWLTPILWGISIAGAVGQVAYSFRSNEPIQNPAFMDKIVGVMGKMAGKVADKFNEIKEKYYDVLPTPEGYDEQFDIILMRIRDILEMPNDMLNSTLKTILPDAWVKRFIEIKDRVFTTFFDILFNNVVLDIFKSLVGKGLGLLAMIMKVGPIDTIKMLEESRGAILNPPSILDGNTWEGQKEIWNENIKSSNARDWYANVDAVENLGIRDELFDLLYDLDDKDTDWATQDTDYIISELGQFQFELLPKSLQMAFVMPYDNLKVAQDILDWFSDKEEDNEDNRWEKQVKTRIGIGKFETLLFNPSPSEGRMNYDSDDDTWYWSKSPDFSSYLPATVLSSFTIEKPDGSFVVLSYWSALVLPPDIAKAAVDIKKKVRGSEAYNVANTYFYTIRNFGNDKSNFQEIIPSKVPDGWSDAKSKVMPIMIDYLSIIIEDHEKLFHYDEYKKMDLIVDNNMKPELQLFFDNDEFDRILNLHRDHMRINNYRERERTIFFREKNFYLFQEKGYGYSSVEESEVQMDFKPESLKKTILFNLGILDHLEAIDGPKKSEEPKTRLEPKPEPRIGIGKLTTILFNPPTSVQWKFDDLMGRIILTFLHEIGPTEREKISSTLIGKTDKWAEKNSRFFGCLSFLEEATEVYKNEDEDDKDNDQILDYISSLERLGFIDTHLFDNDTHKIEITKSGIRALGNWDQKITAQIPWPLGDDISNNSLRDNLLPYIIERDMEDAVSRVILKTIIEYENKVTSSGKGTHFTREAFIDKLLETGLGFLGKNVVEDFIVQLEKKGIIFFRSLTSNNPTLVATLTNKGIGYLNKENDLVDVVVHWPELVQLLTGKYVKWDAERDEKEEPKPKKQRIGIGKLTTIMFNPPVRLYGVVLKVSTRRTMEKHGTKLDWSYLTLLLPDGTNMFGRIYLRDYKTGEIRASPDVGSLITFETRSLSWSNTRDTSEAPPFLHLEFSGITFKRDYKVVTELSEVDWKKMYSNIIENLGIPRAGGGTFITGTFIDYAKKVGVYSEAPPPKPEPTPAPTQATQKPRIGIGKRETILFNPDEEDVDDDIVYMIQGRGYTMPPDWLAINQNDDTVVNRERIEWEDLAAWKIIENERDWLSYIHDKSPEDFVAPENENQKKLEEEGFTFGRPIIFVYNGQYIGTFPVKMDIHQCSDGIFPVHPRISINGLKNMYIAELEYNVPEAFEIIREAELDYALAHVRTGAVVFFFKGYGDIAAAFQALIEEETEETEPEVPKPRIGLGKLTTILFNPKD